jgi:transcriptional regulator with XRE-family HTH domain
MDKAEGAERRKRMLDEMAKRRGQTVKRLRERKGWTMAELARRAGVSESYISRFESGSIPSAAAQVVSDLATALEVSVDYLMNQGGSRSAQNGEQHTNEPDVNDPELKLYLSNIGGLPEDDRNLIKEVIKQMLDLEEQHRHERNRSGER